MLIFNIIAFAYGIASIYAGLSGRLSTIITDPDTGQDMGSGIGNHLAIGGGICVLVAAVS